MQRQRDGLVPIAEAFSDLSGLVPIASALADLPGPVQAIREASP